jgi:single-stranded-DNA-specific exonuclease
VDATFGLERNTWNGTVEPRLLLRRACAPRCGPIEVVGEAEDWADAVRDELAAPLNAWPRGSTPGTGAFRDRRGGGAAGVIAALVATGERVLVVAADARSRREHLGGRLGGFALTSWRALERDPALAGGCDHVVLLDPPPHPALQALAAPTVDRMAHLAWGHGELSFSWHVHRHLHALREPLAAAYRALRAGGGAPSALVAADGRPLHPVLAARLLRVLAELELVELDAATLHAPVVAGARRRDLAEAPCFAACEARLREAEPWLTPPDVKQAAA